MNEELRMARNAQRLTELHPAFASLLRRVIRRLEADGKRPRIQDAWRSPAEQLAAFRSGHSKLKFGFHNVSGANGERCGLAVDLLDDNAPTSPGSEYLLRLARAARDQQLETGIRWGLPARLVAAVDAAISNGDWRARVKVGWDPTHVQPVGVTPAEAQARVSAGVDPF